METFTWIGESVVLILTIIVAVLEIKRSKLELDKIEKENKDNESA